MPSVISSLAGLLVNRTFSPAVLLRGLGIGFALVLSACQKQEAEQSGEKKSPLANTAPDDGKRQFEADVEKSKQNAVARFPDLGVAGSEMNKAFVARVKHLRALNSPEFNYPTWPYQLACQVDYEVQAVKQEADRLAKQQEADRLAKQAAKNSKDIQGLIRKCTVTELLQEKTIPFAEILLCGMVTKVETGVGNRLSGVVFIDRKVRCDFELPPAVYRDQKIELVDPEKHVNQLALN